MTSLFRAAAAALLLAASAACSRGEEQSPQPAPSRAATAPAVAPAMAPAATVDERTRRADLARIRGDSAAPVWLREISDFQCPYCKVWHDSVYQAIDREYVATGKVRLAYVHFPLPNHQNARPAAEATMCAAAQGRFWEMHSLVFDTQGQWAGMPDATSHFAALAARAGVDSAAVRACLASAEMRPVVDADFQRARSAGVRSTPTFIVGDSIIEGAAPVAEFRRVIDAVLADARRARPATPAP